MQYTRDRRDKSPELTLNNSRLGSQRNMVELGVPATSGTQSINAKETGRFLNNSPRTHHASAHLQEVAVRNYIDETQEKPRPPAVSMVGLVPHTDASA